MQSLPNYLRTSRKRTSFTQEEVAFLLGVKGIDRANKVLRDEKSERVPTLEVALAYELIYGEAVGDLFAGMRQRIAWEIARRAKVLRERKNAKIDPRKSGVLADLLNKASLSASQSNKQ